MSASAWQVVTATSCQPADSGSVLRGMQDGSRILVLFPQSIILCNTYMGGVDRGDQLRGYYHCRTKNRKFYEYILYPTRCCHYQCLHPDEESHLKRVPQVHQRFAAPAGITVVSAGVNAHPPPPFVPFLFSTFPSRLTIPTLLRGEAIAPTAGRPSTTK